MLIGISPLYIHLFYIDVVAVSVQVLLMAILNVLFYLDARREVLIITACFFITNLRIHLRHTAAGRGDFRLRVCRLGNAVGLSRPFYPVAQVQPSGIRNVHAAELQVEIRPIVSQAIRQRRQDSR